MNYKSPKNSDACNGGEAMLTGRTYRVRVVNPADMLSAIREGVALLGQGVTQMVFLTGQEAEARQWLALRQGDKRSRLERQICTHRRVDARVST